MVFEAIRKSTAPEMVARQIMDRITSGQLKPGQRLPSQRELAQALSVGRSSVREAINALAVMGYLQVKHGQGTFISLNLPDADDAVKKLGSALEAGSLMDLMEVRQLLECKSAALAAERADQQQIERLEATLEAMENATGDYQGFLEADLAFHSALAEASGNSIICEMMKLITGKVSRQHARLRTGRLSSEYRRLSIVTAANVVAAIAAGDARQARAQMAKHLGLIDDQLKEIVP